jgi:hypothetical protein
VNDSGDGFNSGPGGGGVGGHPDDGFFGEEAVDGVFGEDCGGFDGSFDGGPNGGDHGGDLSRGGFDADFGGNFGLDLVMWLLMVAQDLVVLMLVKLDLEVFARRFRLVFSHPLWRILWAGQGCGFGSMRHCLPL